MSNLNAFLHPITENLGKEIVISDRFVERDENGNIMYDAEGNPSLQKFKIRALTQEENEAITKQATRTQIVKGIRQEYLDSHEYSLRLVVAGTVEPNFSSQEVCAFYGVLDPLKVPGKMLLAGEYNKLMSEITELSGFNISAEAEAKN